MSNLGAFEGRINRLGLPQGRAIEDGEGGLSARTIKRRLARIGGLYEYLLIRGDTAVSQNPVPRGLAMRRPGQRPSAVSR